ncbi:MAG: tetratricopeptide repeat protein [Terrimicrobiaceae bacterium]
MDFSASILRLSPGAENILADEEEEDGCLWLARGFFWLFGQTAEAQNQAGRALQMAAEHPGGPRSESWFTALQLWHAKDFDRSASAFEEITTRWPDDLLAAKAAEFLYYVLGQQHSGPRFLQHLNRLGPVHGGDPDFLSMEAFARELCGDMSGARRSAEAALGIESRLPWAQHALEHVLLWEGNSEEALHLLAGWVADWEASARPIHSHNAWHYAVALLDRQDNEKAMEVFDRHVWMKTPDLVVEQLDSISFLWRAEMAGVPVGEPRWKALAGLINPREVFMPFASAHYAYAAGRAGCREVLEELLERTTQRARDTDAEAVRVWSGPGLDVVRASAALGCGDAAAAARFFDPAALRLTEIGGSDAQDDLFRFAHIHSLRLARRRSDALQLLRARLCRKTPSPMEADWLAGLS